MFDLLLPSGVKGLKGYPEIFKEKSDGIRSIPPTVLKKLKKHSWQSSYSVYLQAFKLANMLNTVFLLISAGPQISASLLKTPHL